MKQVAKWMLGVTAIAIASFAFLTLPRFSSASTALPAKGCRFCTQGASTASVHWLKLVAGVTYTFTDHLLSRGANPFWEAEYGTITASGSYTAPSYMPPLGLDTISYMTADGSTASVTIRIVANPNLPDSGYPRYLRRTTTVLQSYPNYPPVFSYQLIGGASQNVLSTGEMNSIGGSAPIPVLEPGDTYDAPVRVVDCVSLPIAASKAHKREFSVLSNAIFSDSRRPITSLVVTSPTEYLTPFPGPEKCKPTPINPWSSNQNKGYMKPDGEHRVYGSWGKRTKKRIKDQAVAIELGASSAAEISGRYGITPAVGTRFSGRRTIWEWSRTRHNDIYVCKNGVWTFARSETCRMTASAETTIPIWMAYIDGYASNGEPGPWSPESCQ